MDISVKYRLVLLHIVVLIAGRVGEHRRMKRRMTPGRGGRMSRHKRPYSYDLLLS